MDVRARLTVCVLLAGAFCLGCGQKETTPPVSPAPETPAVEPAPEPAPAQAPVLAPAPADQNILCLFDFEDGQTGLEPEDELKEFVEVTVVNEPEHASAGTHSLKVTLKPHQWPGVRTVNIPADWTAYETLKFDVFALELMDLQVRIDDVNSKDYLTRYHAPSSLIDKGMNTVTVYIADIAGSLDVKNIKLLCLFSTNVTEPVTFYVDNVRLEKKK